MSIERLRQTDEWLHRTVMFICGSAIIFLLILLNLNFIYLLTSNTDALVRLEWMTTRLQWVSYPIFVLFFVRNVVFVYLRVWEWRNANASDMETKE